MAQPTKVWGREGCRGAWRRSKSSRWLEARADLIPGVRFPDEIKEDEMDGLIINLHGATVSEEYLDVDGEVLYRLRKKLCLERTQILTNYLITV